MSAPEVYALDLDEEFLSHLALPDSIHVIWNEEIDDRLIEDPAVREIYHWQFAHMREHGAPATPSVLADQFDVDFDEPLTAPGDLIDRMRERYIRNNARKHMEAVSDAYKEHPAKVIEVLPRVAREIQQIVGKKGDSFTEHEAERALHVYDHDLLHTKKASFGFADVDAHFNRMRGLTFLVAAPKTMKSWLTINATCQNVLDGKNVWLYPLELEADETDMRVRCMLANVPYWRYIRGTLTQDDREAIKEASNLVAEGEGSYKVVHPAIGHRSFEEMVERAGEGGADAVLIDQLQYVETLAGRQLGGGGPQDYWQPLNAARDMSKEMPLWIVHQFNRSVMNADKMPEMQQAKGAASIEETATLALGLWANKDMKRSGIVELGTLASRNHEYEAWEIGVDLSRGCNFEMIGKAVHEEDE